MLALAFCLFHLKIVSILVWKIIYICSEWNRISPILCVWYYIKIICETFFFRWKSFETMIWSCLNSIRIKFSWNLFFLKQNKNEKMRCFSSLPMLEFTIVIITSINHWLRYYFLLYHRCVMIPNHFSVVFKHSFDCII